MQEVQILKMLNTSDADLEWFRDNINRLKEKYDQNYIAIENNEVLAHDKTINGLIKKLRQMGKDSSKIFIQFVSKLRVVL